MAYDVLASGPNSGDLQVIIWSDRNGTDNSEVLTAAFFNVAGNRALTPLSATVPIKSATDGTINNSFVYGKTNYGFNTPLNVGREWRYDTGLSGVPGGQTQGIGSAGLDVFGNDGNFGGTDLNGNESLSPLVRQKHRSSRFRGRGWHSTYHILLYGYRSVGQGPAGGNIGGEDFGLIGLDSSGVAGKGYDVLVKNTAIFVLDVPAGFDLDPSRDISDTFIQYGTTFASTLVSEPSTMLLLGSGLIGLTGYGKKKFLKE